MAITAQSTLVNCMLRPYERKGPSCGSRRLELRAPHRQISDCHRTLDNECIGPRCKSRDYVGQFAGGYLRRPHRHSRPSNKSAAVAGSGIPSESSPSMLSPSAKPRLPAEAYRENEPSKSVMNKSAGDRPKKSSVCE